MAVWDARVTRHPHRAELVNFPSTETLRQLSVHVILGSHTVYMVILRSKTLLGEEFHCSSGREAIRLRSRYTWSERCCARLQG